MNTNKVLLGVGLVVMLVLGLVFPRSGGTVVERIVDKTVGAVSGPDSFSPYQADNGVVRWSYSSAFNNASTTVCSFKGPAATTTVDLASYKVTTATSSAIVFDIGVGSFNDATTTKIASTISLAASSLANVVASTTNANIIVGPNQYVNFKFGTGPITLTTNSLGGSCKVILIEL